MSEISTVGVDLGKNVIHVCGMDATGAVVLRKRFSRRQFQRWAVRCVSCRMGLESCAGAHYWARTLSGYGHDVRVIHPRYVKPYVKTNKNDTRDAEAIAEALSRPTMRFVAIKTVAQQESRMRHRVRQRVMRERTALSNQIRGFLLDFGLPVARGRAALRRRLPAILEDGDNGLGDRGRALLWELWHELQGLDERLAVLDKQIAAEYQADSAARRLRTIPGIGPLTATATVAAIGGGGDFDRARGFAAWLGLVPRHDGTGGQTRLLGISKRGDRYLRTLYIHCARAALRTAAHHDAHWARWALALAERRGRNVAVVALANKLARMAWAVLTRGEHYQPQPA